VKNKLLKWEMRERREKKGAKKGKNMGTIRAISVKKMFNANEKFTSLLTMRNRRRSVTFYFNFTCSREINKNILPPLKLHQSHFIEIEQLNTP
jgi:hypothetical protein